MAKRVICRKELQFPKIAYCSTRRIYNVFIQIELRKCGGDEIFKIENGQRVYLNEKTEEYTELSICGTIQNPRAIDCAYSGQCLDTMLKYGTKAFHKALNTEEKVTFGEIFQLWMKYHLNGMHAGTPKQEELVKEYFATEGQPYDYETAKKVLADNNLLVDDWKGEPYQYGTKWLHYDLPEEVIERVKRICKA